MCYKAVSIWKLLSRPSIAAKASPVPDSVAIHPGYTWLEALGENIIVVYWGRTYGPASATLSVQSSVFQILPRLPRFNYFAAKNLALLVAGQPRINQNMNSYIYSYEKS